MWFILCRCPCPSIHLWSISSESVSVIQLIWCPLMSVTSHDGQRWAAHTCLPSHWSFKSLLTIHWLLMIWSSPWMTDRPGHMGLHNFGQRAINILVITASHMGVSDGICVTRPVSHVHPLLSQLIANKNNCIKNRSVAYWPGSHFPLLPVHLGSWCSILHLVV